MGNPTKILPYDLDAQFQKLLDELEQVNDDFKLAELESGMKVSERLKEIEHNVMSISLEQLETGNFSEAFTYEDGNVIKHEVTGDKEYTVEYGYNENQEITTSKKTFTNSDGELVEIIKTYSYTDGDITEINTTTTIVPTEED